MIGKMKREVLAGCLLTALVCFGRYPTVEEVRNLFDCDRSAKVEYEDFLDALYANRSETPLAQRLQMKDWLLMTLTSTVVRVSTNVVDDGTVTFTRGGARGLAFRRALQSFGPDFTTNVTDCLSVAEYLGRVRTVEVPADLRNRMMSVLYVTRDPQKREEWYRKSIELRENRKKVRERIRLANDSILDYRRALFDLCNSCVIANRKIMDDAEFAAFTNRVVELSKPDEREKRRLFDHLDGVRRK